MTRAPLFEEDLTFSVIGAFFESYNTHGFGFREFLYLSALERELRACNHQVGREVLVRVMYKGEELGVQKIDMIVDEKLVVEVKSTFALDRNATRQLYNYLRATNLELGLLLHYGPQPKFYRVTCLKRSLPTLTTARSNASD
jgi:GxxExxY protein